MAEFYKDLLDEEGPQHVFVAGRCLHCHTDDHSLPAAGEELANWEKPCPVAYEDRQTVWSFGDSATNELLKNIGEY